MAVLEGQQLCALQVIPKVQTPALQLPGSSEVPWLFSLLDLNSNEEKILLPDWITLNSQVQYPASNILTSPFVSACGPETSNQTIVHGLGQGAMHKACPKSFISSASLSDTSKLLHSHLPIHLRIQEAPSSVVLRLWPVPFFYSSGWSKAQQWKYLRHKWSPSSFLPQYYPQKMNFTRKHQH